MLFMMAYSSNSSNDVLVTANILTVDINNYVGDIMAGIH